VKYNVFTMTSALMCPRTTRTPPSSPCWPCNPFATVRSPRTTTCGNPDSSTFAGAHIAGDQLEVSDTLVTGVEKVTVDHQVAVDDHAVRAQLVPDPVLQGQVAVDMPVPLVEAYLLLAGDPL
jgi:hypothetical protein